MNFSTSENLDFQRYCIATYGSIGNLIHEAKKGEIDAQVHLALDALTRKGLAISCRKMTTKRLDG